MMILGKMRGDHEVEVINVDDTGPPIDGFVSIEVLWRPAAECRAPRIGDVLEVRYSDRRPYAIPPTPTTPDPARG